MKNNKKQLATKILLSLVIGIYHAVPAYALPNQGTLDNSNAAAISTQGTTMSITGKGANNILNWATFSIDKGETVKFTDKSNYLNLVRGVDISRIYGTMSGGGTVYLVNPNGILFGQGAKLDNVGSFIASTRNISAINQDAFLNNPNDTTAVLGTDSKEMDNKDYYPEYWPSSFTTKISVADIELTNVPQSATKIVLDGPGGVILKSAEVLNKTTQVLTRKDGGEIGIGSGSEQVALTDLQKEKIGLIDGNNIVPLNENPDVLQGYKIVRNMAEFQNQSGTYSSNIPSHYMLVNDIDASNTSNHSPVDASGVFEGMGYEIANLSMNADTDYYSYSGLFGNYSGIIRNLKLSNINFRTQENVGRTSSIGGLAGNFSSGTISNVTVSGKIEGAYVTGGIVGTLQGLSEIRNSSNEANISLSQIDSSKRLIPFSLGGIVGEAHNFTGLLTNVGNTGDIETKPGRDQWGGNVGGIVGKTEGIGTIKSNGTLIIRGAFNKGLVSGDNSSTWLKAINVGGIVGLNDATNASIGEAYNLGKVETRGSWEKSSIGGIVGNEAKGVLVGVSNETGEQLNSYYENEKVNNKTNYGIGITSSEMAEKFKPEMFGIYNATSIESKTTGTPINPGGGDSSSTGGNTGENEGGSTGGNTGGNEGGSTGGNTGGNEGGSTGGNTGGNEGGSTGGNTGGNEGGSTGGMPVVPKPDVPSVFSNTYDAEKKLVESGILPKGYDSEIQVVLDSTNTERIERDTEETSKTNVIKHSYNPYSDIKKIKNDYYTSVIKSLNKTQTVSDRQKEYLKSNVGSYLQSLVDVEPSNNKDKLPASVYSAFLTPVLNSINARIQDYDTKNLMAMVNNFGSLISKWLPSVNNISQVVEDRGIKYNVKFKYALGQVFKADVTWIDNEGSHKATMSINVYGTKESDKMLKSFMTDLSEIGQDAVNNAIDELITAGFGDNKLLKDKMSFAVKLADALIDDAQAEALSNQIGGNFQNVVQQEGILFFKKSARDKLEDLIVSKVPNGDKIVEQIKQIKEFESKLDEYNKKLNSMSNVIETYSTNDDPNKKIEASYLMAKGALERGCNF